MDKIIKKGFMVGLGLASIAKEEVEKKVIKLQKEGKINKKEAKKFLNKVNKIAKTKQGHIINVVSREVDKAYHAIGIATRKDLRNLEKRPRKKKK